MAVVLNGFPNREYDVVFHVETAERHHSQPDGGTPCYRGLEDRLDMRTFDEYVRSGVASPPAEVAFVVPPTESVREFAEMMNRLEPAVRRGGLDAGDVLVIIDCWGKSGPDCSSSDTAERIDWSPLSSATSFDFSVWDHDRCPEGHARAAAVLSVGN